MRVDITVLLNAPIVWYNGILNGVYENGIPAGISVVHSYH